MHCASCVTKIEKELKQNSGVISASVDLGTESAIINYIPGLINVNEIKTQLISSVIKLLIQQD